MAGNKNPLLKRRRIQGRFRLNREHKPYATTALTPQFGEYSRRNAGLVVRVYKALLQKTRGQKAIIPNGVKIVETYTGTYGGTLSKQFKVTFEGKDFFVKLIPNYSGQNHPEKYEQAEKLFRSVGYRVGRYKLALIRPHLVYSPISNDAFRVVVTDFYNAGEVIHVTESGLPKEQFKEKFGEEFRQLESLFLNTSITDTGRHNFFYHKKSGTLLFFDPN